MPKQQQSGIALLELLLTLVLVAVIGFTGYYVWHSRNATDEALQPIKDSSSTVAKKPAAVTHDADTANWLAYSAPSGHYTMRLADGWKLDRYMKVDSLYAFDTLNATYSPGTTAIVTEQQGGRDGSAVGLFINYFADSKDASGKPQGTVAQGFKTDQGFDVTSYVYTETSSSNDGIGGLPKGGKQYSYTAQKDNAVLFVSYGIDANSPDQHAVVERSIKTFEFK